MPNRKSALPEGTDSIVAGAAATGAEDFTPAIPLAGGEGEGTGLRDRIASFREQASERTAGLRDQAGDKARALAEQGKAHASAALEGMSRLIGEAAIQVDDRIGRDYGDYARRAQDGVASLATTLRDTDFETLLDDARALVRRNPAIAVGAAALAGFALVRLIRSGGAPEDDAAAD